MERLIQDLRYAMRIFWKRPGFSAAVIVTLALGIGANTAIFTVFNGVLLQPLPYTSPDQVVRVYTQFNEQPAEALSPPEFFDLQDQIDAFANFGAYVTGIPVSLTGDDSPERVRAAVVTREVFAALGSDPILGRTFTADEDSPGGPAAAILSHELWSRRFGSADDVIGSEMIANGASYRIIGVLSPEFRLPQEFGTRQPSELFVPLAIDRTSIPNRGSHFLDAVARLEPGVSAEQADAAVRTVAAGFVENYPADYPPEMGFGAAVVPIHEDIVGPVRPALLILLGTVSLVLLIAIANVASLLLSRADARRREFAVRAALGAGRGRLIRQLLVESLMLAGFGGALGLLLAHWATRTLVALQPGAIPRADTLGIDPAVLAFTGAVSVFVGIAFGLVPALRATRASPAGGLRGSGTGADAGRHSEQRVLVVSQVALTVMLLVGAGLLTRSFVTLYSVDPGFRAERVLTATVALPPASYPEVSDVTSFYRELLPRLRALPGAEAVGAVSSLPLATELGDLNFHIEGAERSEATPSPRADWQVVTPGYFRAMGIPILAGRGIEERDGADAPGAVVINETTAERYWPGENPIGRSFELGAGAGPGRVSIVGVVPDIRHNSLDAPPSPQMYIPHAQFRMWDSGRPIGSMTLVLATTTVPSVLAGGVRREVNTLDSDIPLADIQAMDRVISDSLARPRFLALLLVLFAGLALALAAVGVYGVVSYAVTRRTREIGVRMALGARAAEVLRLVLQQGFVLALIGILVGLGGALAATRVLESFLYEVSARDPLIFASVALGLLCIVLLASWLPARRAANLDPVIALRND